MHPIVESRNDEEHFNSSFPDLLKSEQNFFNWFRMFSKSFFELYDSIKGNIEKETTNMRRPVYTNKRLILILW